ncbi:MAG: MATE family efflux transporter [Pseudomonadota bacterium]
MTPFLPRLKWHVAELLTLAWPVMLSRAGILIMALVDIIMLGNYGFGAVGISNLGISIFVPILVVTIGLCSGLVPVVSQAYGAGAWGECGRAWRRALVWGGFLSIFATWLTCQAEWLLLVFGQSPKMATGGASVAYALAPGMTAQVIFAVCAFYLESTGRPRFAMTAMLVANIVNFGLNWVLIFGNLGMPELGAVGAALASTLARIIVCGMMLWVILTQANAIEAGVRGPWETFWGPGGWRAGWPMRKLGMSAGISNGFETFGFAAMTMFAGQLGALALDAYSIVHNLMATVFMIGLGLSIATGVRVGNEIGRGRMNEAVFAGWTGLGLGLAIMTTMGLITWFGRDTIAWLYASDPDVIARAAVLCMICAFVYAPDCGQIVLGQAVRAFGDAWMPILCYLVSFTVFMVPFGWWMVNGWGWDERGLLIAIMVACWIATILLALRFWTLARRAHELRHG